MNKLFTKVLLLPVAVVGLATMIIGFGVNAQGVPKTVDVQLTITGGTLTHGAPTSIDFGSIGLPSTDTIMSKAFSGTFWVEDFKGINSGYYTTISVTDLVGVNTNSVISGGQLMIRSTTGLVLEAGTANANVTAGDINGVYRQFAGPITYIQRATATNNGVIGRYGAETDLQITVPAYQAPDHYTGTITFTLYER